MVKYIIIFVLIINKEKQQNATITQADRRGFLVKKYEGSMQ